MSRTEIREIKVPKVGTRWISEFGIPKGFATVIKVSDSYSCWITYRYDGQEADYDYCDTPEHFFAKFEPAPKTAEEALNEIRDYISGYSGPLIDHIKNVIAEVK
jgi:hypothetical protein